MDITNLILLCGDAVQLQPLDHCFTKFDAANSRNPTRIQFGTEADCYATMLPGGGFGLRGNDQGLVVWVPRDKVKDLIASQDWSSEDQSVEKAVTLQFALQRALAGLSEAEQGTAKELLEMLDDRIGKHSLD